MVFACWVGFVLEKELEMGRLGDKRQTHGSEKGQVKGEMGR